MQNTNLTIWLALTVLVSSCGGGGGGKGPLPELASVLSYTTPQQSAYSLTANETYPKQIDAIVLRHTGAEGEIDYSLVDSSGAVRANPGSGRLEPGETLQIKIEALGLSYTTAELQLTCTYEDRDRSTDTFVVKFSFLINGGSLPKLDTVFQLTDPTALRHLLTPVTNLPKRLDSVTLNYTATSGPPVTFEILDGLKNVVANPATGKLNPGRSTQVDIHAAKSTFGLTLLRVVVAYDVLASNDVIRRTWNFRNAAPPSLSALAALHQITKDDPNVATVFWPGVDISPVGVIVKHIMGGPRDKIPELLFAEMGLVGSMSFVLTPARIDASFWLNKTNRGTSTEDALFLPGPGPNGYTVHPNMEVDLKDGTFRIFHLTTERSIPLRDPNTKNAHIYAFAVDSDLSGPNNYVPDPGFPNHFLKDTDRHYQVFYQQNTTTKEFEWTMTVNQVDTSNKVTEVASAARAIITDNAILLVVPGTEFAAARPTWRAATFVHEGDFGINAPYVWSGDVMPAVDQPLLQLD